jgi:carboxylesterase family protein
MAAIMPQMVVVRQIPVRRLPGEFPTEKSGLTGWKLSTRAFQSSTYEVSVADYRSRNPEALQTCTFVPVGLSAGRDRKLFDLNDKIGRKEIVMNPTYRISPSSRRNFLKHISALAVSGGVFLNDLKAQDATSIIAETAFGKIRGVDIDGIKIFKGIPYGASTAGTNRFMPPAEPADWSGVRDAFAYGHSARSRTTPLRRPRQAPLRSRARTCRPRAKIVSCSMSGRPP